MSNITLEIGRPITSKNPKNTFVVDVEVMHGDGDHYNNVIFKATNEKKVIQFIDLFDRMKAEYPRGRGGGDNYYHIDGFDDLVNDNWPQDITCEDSQAGIESYSVFYYNEDGIKHNVKVKRGKIEEKVT